MNCPSQAILLIVLSFGLSGCTTPGMSRIWPSREVATAEAGTVEQTAATDTSTPPLSPELAALITDLATSTTIDPAKRAEMMQVVESLREVDPAYLPAILPTVRHRAFGSVPQAPPASAAQIAQPTSPSADSAISLDSFEPLGKRPVAAPVFGEGPLFDAKVEQAGYAQVMTNLPSSVTHAEQAPTPQVIENRTITPTGPSPSSLNTLNKASTDSLQSHLASAIRVMESELSGETESDYQKTLAAKLRFLHLLAGDRERALEPIADASVSEQEFWTKQMYGLSCMLDTAMLSDRSHRFAQAKEHLDLAVTSLGEECNLVVRNLHFVTEAMGYGEFAPFKEYKFQPFEQVILYAEIENFVSEQSPQGFATSLKSRYEIVDSSGNVVDHEEIPSNDTCRNRRHDFFTVLQFNMPKIIYPGKYTLRLMIEDRLSQKVGQASIEFDIRANGN